MTCEQIERMLYLPEELTTGEIEIKEAHLKNCPACREKVREMQNAQQMIRSAADAPVYPENAAALTGKVMSGIQFPSGNQGQVLPWLRWIRYGYAAGIAALLLFFLAEWSSYDFPPPVNTTSPAVKASLSSPGLKEIRKPEKDQGVSLYQLYKQNNSK